LQSTEVKGYEMLRRLFPLAVLISLSIGISAAFAQQTERKNIEPGSTRIQGRTVETDKPPPPTPFDPLIDLREEMRKLILSISQFARKHRPNFKIIARGGANLLVKRDDVDETRLSPARTYRRSIDGILEEGMFFDNRNPAKPPVPARQKHQIRLAEAARESGLVVLAVDYADLNTLAKKVHVMASSRGFLSFAADRQIDEIFTLPTYPLRPFGENTTSINSLKQLKNFVIIGNSQPFGRQDEFSLRVHGTNFDMVVVDVFHGRSPLSRQAVETLKYKQLGAKRLVLALMDVGTAASYHFYWKDGWREGSPLWIGPPVRNDPDHYQVEFWRPGWQNLITGDTNSYVYGLIAQGFDGVVIGGLDAYKFFEGGDEEEEQGEAQ